MSNIGKNESMVSEAHINCFLTRLGLKLYIRDSHSLICGILNIKEELNVLRIDENIPWRS